MAVTAERFAQGMTYDEYKVQMTRNRERLEAKEQQVELDPQDLEAFKALPGPLNVLALAEDWCGDVIANLPVLARLAEDSGQLNVRVFLRDQNLDLIDQYLNKGEFRSIPVFVFFDESFQELGHFIERPASVSELVNQKRQELFAQNPDFGSPDAPIAELPEEVRTRLMQAMGAVREEIRPFADREVVRELRVIAERAKG